MDLPQQIEAARVLITVKAYPKPSSKYQELVCTAGLWEGEEWIRIYPVPFRFFEDSKKYPKYGWLTIDLLRNEKDFRPESYRPKKGLDEEFKVHGTLGTQDAWAARKSYVLDEVFTSMSQLIDLAYSEEHVSLGTLKPTEIVGFDIEESEREWKHSWQDHSLQPSFSDLTSSGEAAFTEPVDKVPYDYYYRFLTEGDDRPRKLKIEDWEIGALFWNCLRRANGDEEAANELVRQKYWDEFVSEKDLYLFLGTTLKYHRMKASNPFIIIGVFYPPKTDQEMLL